MYRPANDAVNDQRAAELLCRFRDAYPGPELPVPVESVAEDLLGLNIERSWTIDVSGALLPAERRILLNAHEFGRTQPLKRYRFTVAHEIGHWICHALGRVPQPIYCRAVGSDLDGAVSREREADRFAASLLMPADHVLADWEPYGIELESLVSGRFGREAVTRWLRAATRSVAEVYDVSPTAMQWRLVNLGLVTVPFEP